MAKVHGRMWGKDEVVLGRDNGLLIRGIKGRNRKNVTGAQKNFSGYAIP
jgi:hypothetical protein